MSYNLTELVDAIRDDNPSVKMPYVMDIYYNKEAKYAKLPCEVNKETDMEGSTMNSENVSVDGDQEENGPRLQVAVMFQVRRQQSS